VDRFVGTVEKGKSVGIAPVNEEIVEDLLQRMEQSSKKSLRKLSLHAYRTVRTVRKNLNFYSHKITTLQELRLSDSGGARILQLVFEQFE
jgi:hypothetical protein